jgi:hypothetical protein
MAITTVVSTKELERVAAAAYEGEEINVMLCNLTDFEVNQDSLISVWDDYEIPGNGYVRYSTAIGTGSYSNVTGSYLLPDITAEFTASGAGYSYNTVVIFITGSSYPHSILREVPNIVLSAGQTQSYGITLVQDD